MKTEKKKRHLALTGSSRLLPAVTISPWRMPRIPKSPINGNGTQTTAALSQLTLIAFPSLLRLSQVCVVRQCVCDPRVEVSSKKIKSKKKESKRAREQACRDALKEHEPSISSFSCISSLSPSRPEAIEVRLAIDPSPRPACQRRPHLVFYLFIVSPTSSILSPSSSLLQLRLPLHLHRACSKPLGNA